MSDMLFVAIYAHGTEEDRSMGTNGTFVECVYTSEQLRASVGDDRARGYLAFFANGQRRLEGVNDANDYLKQR